VGLKRGLFFVEKPPQQSRRVKVVVKVVLWFVAMESKTKTRDWCRLLPKDTKKWIFFFLFFHIETKTLNPKRTTSLCLCFLLHQTKTKILERERGRAFDTFFSPSLLKALFLYTSSFLRHTTHWTFLSMLRCVFLFSDDDDDDDDDEKCNENTTNNHRDCRSFSFSFSSFSARAFLRRIKIVIIIIKYLTLFFSKSIL